VEQRLWKPLAAVSRAYLVAELLEPLALCRSDLPVDRIEECKRCQQVLTRAALAPEIIPAPPPGRLTDPSEGRVCSRPSRSPMMANFSLPSSPTATGSGQRRRSITEFRPRRL